MGYKIEANPDKLEAFANNIVNELAFLEDQADTLNEELDKIIKFCSPEYLHCFSGVGNTAATSDKLIERLDKHEKDVRNAGGKLTEQDDILGQMYKLYEDYGAFVGLGNAVATPGKYLIGGFTKYLADGSGKWSYRSPQYLDDLARMIDNTKWKNVVRTLLYPNVASNHHQAKSIVELLHRKFTGFFPDDVVNFTNTMQGLFKGEVDNLGRKITFGNAISSGWKFARVGLPLTVTLTAGFEAVGAGITIADNYNKYGNNLEVLKRENAKAVGKAVNNTIWVTGGSVIGTMIGGGVGTLFTPAGTVVGGVAGGVAGAWVGEKMAFITAGAVETLALKADDSIHKGIEGIRKINGEVTEAIEKGTKVFNDVKDVANDQIKKQAETISKAATNVSKQITEKVDQGIDTVKATAEKTKEKINEGVKQVEDTASNMIDGAKKLISNPFSFG